MERKLGVGVLGGAGSEKEDPAAVRRGPPGQRGANEGAEAVVELLPGRATVDQVAFRLPAGRHGFGIQASTVEKWRQVALEGIEQSMRQGTGKSKRERELEKKLKVLERAFKDLDIRHELVERASSQRPIRPLSAPGRRRVSQMSPEPFRGKAEVRQQGLGL